jgi:hypothetical protein
MVYDLSKFGVPTYAPTKAIAGNPHTGTSAYTSSPRRNVSTGPSNPGHASAYGIDKNIIAGDRSEWGLDDDTKDFLSEAFQTFGGSPEEEAYGGGSGGGGGGGGPGYAGGPGGEYGVTWDFGKSPSFKPRGIL